MMSTHDERDEWITRALGIAPGQTLRIPDEELGRCSHCGEMVTMLDDPGECAHGVAHGQCILDAQSIGECEGVA